MPDPLRKTISATQVPALFNTSPYQTRWMLWNRFVHGLADELPETSRMKWGKLLQAPIMAEVAREWKLEVIANPDYYRRGLVGATRDATIVAPGKGPGAVEIKCCFDYAVWAAEWRGGRCVPRHHEIQLQTQMLVGDGDGGPSYQWGLIVAWVCADLYYFERRPVIELWNRMGIEAGRFFRSVERKEEPDPFGVPIEIPWLTDLFPVREGSVLDLSAEHGHVKTAEDVQQYRWHAEQRLGHEKAEEELKAKLLGLAKDNSRVLLPCGVSYTQRKHGKGKRIMPYVPDVPLPAPPPVPETMLHAG